MSTFVFANNVSTSLASAISSTATTITLASSTNLPIVPPGSYFPLTLNDKATGTVYEIVYVTAITGVSLTVIRGQEGTTAQSWLVGDYAYGAFTAQSVLTANPGYLLNPMTTAGDLIVGGASGAAQRLGAGTNGQVLTIASGVPSWGTTPGSVSPDTVLARNGTVSHATSQTLTATDSGKIIVYKGTSSAGTFQLPAAASATAGELVYAVYTSGSQPCTLVPGAGGDSAPTISVTTGNILAVVNDGVSSWTIITNTNGNPSTNFKAAPPVATNDVVTLGYASAAYQPAGSYAALAGSSAQAFDVARATTPTKAPQLSQMTLATMLDEAPATTSGLTWGYQAGVVRADNVITAVAAGTVTLTASTTNYVEVTNAGTVVVNTTGFTPGNLPLRTLVTGASSITSDTDSRAFLAFPQSGALAGVTLQDYSEVVYAIGTVSATTLAANMTNGNVQTLTLGNSLTLSITNAAASGKATNLTLYIYQDATGSRVITWPTLMTGTTAPPALKTAAGAMNVVTLTSIDGGASWMIKVVE